MWRCSAKWGPSLPLLSAGASALALTTRPTSISFANFNGEIKQVAKWHQKPCLCQPYREESNAMKNANIVGDYQRIIPDGTHVPHGASDVAVVGVSSSGQLEPVIGAGLDLRPSANEHCLVSPTGKQITADGKEVPPTHWGLTRAQLHRFLKECRKDPDWSENMSVRELDEKIIRKRYNKGLSVAVTYNDQSPKVINVLISHCWDEKAGIFLQRCLDVTRATGDAFPDGESNVSIFICFLSQYQGTPAEINLQVKQGSEDIKDGVFAVVLKCIKQLNGCMIVIPCKEVIAQGGLYSRLWCAWEVYNALVDDVPIYIDYSPDSSWWHHFSRCLALFFGVVFFFTTLLMVPLCSSLLGVLAGICSSAILYLVTAVLIYFRRTKSIMTYYFGDSDISTFDVEKARCGNPLMPPGDDEQAIRHEIANDPNVGWHRINLALKDIARRIEQSIYGESGSKKSQHFTEVIGLQYYTTRIERPFRTVMTFMMMSWFCLGSLVAVLEALANSS